MQEEKITIHKLLKEREDAVNKLITDCRVFFAFSNKQFEENKTPKDPDEKYLDIGMGGFMPKSQLENYIQGMKKIHETFDEGVAKHELRKSYILYELNNHEAFYTGDTETTLDALGKDYTQEEVDKVFKDYKAEKYAVKY